MEPSTNCDRDRIHAVLSTTAGIRNKHELKHLSLVLEEEAACCSSSGSRV